MNFSAALEKTQEKITSLIQRYENSQTINKELKEEIRLLNVQLNDYTELMGELEMEIVYLKKELDKKKK